MRVICSPPVSDQHDGGFRLWGVFPLIFFLAQGLHYWRFGGIGNMLWMCNVGNLLLAIGIFLIHRELIRAAAIWTIPGLLLWVRYVLFQYDFVISSALAHVGGLTIGLIALRRVRMDRWAWCYAFLWYLFLQLVSRLTTDPLLNVNVAWRIQPGWERAFASYWKFWVVMSVLVAVVLCAIGMVLRWIWPADNSNSPVAPAA